MKGHKSDHKSNCYLSAQEHYNDALGQEAQVRVGNNTQLKGAIHELGFRDKCNLNLSNRLKGDITTLSKNPRAHSVDVLTTNKNKVVSRYQLKDCTSDSGISKTLGKERKGQYKSTQLMGTEETAEKYNRMKSPKDRAMKSTGISSKRTGRIADNAGAKSPDKNTVLNNFKDIGSCTLNSAGIGAVSSAAGSIYSNLEKYKNGEIDEFEYMSEVAKDTATGAAKSAATTATALSLKEGGKALGDAIGSEGFRKFMGSNGGTALAYGIADITVKTGQLINGSIDRDEYTQSCAKSVGSSLGGYEGALIGAEIGTVFFPGVGTSIGAGVGGVIGAVGGAEAVDLLYQYNLAEVFSDSVRAVCSTASECSETLVEMASSGAELAEDVLSSGAELAGDVLSSGAELAGDVLSSGAELAGDVLSSGAELAEDVLSSGAELAGDVLSSGAELAGDVLSSGAELAGDVLSSGAEFAGDVLSSGAELAGDVLSSGAELAGDVFSSGAEFLGETISDSYDVISDGVDSVCEGVSSICSSICSWFD